MFADDLAIPVRTLKTYRWVASRWLAQHRRHGVPYYIHKTLASLRDDEERWERITKPPLDIRTKTHRWTDTAAKQAVDQKFADTTSVQQKVERIHDLARDEQVAAAVATDLRRRPEVAFKAIGTHLHHHCQRRIYRIRPPGSNAAKPCRTGGTCNRHRDHTALAGLPPASRAPNFTGQNS
ncbi:DUF6192 family protein [Nonomuraea jabiensis]|uniref:DUF6192 family protein n=1 Tax=Nonomuraea jabiensis TaxID=882448 RepID=UPI0034191ED8